MIMNILKFFAEHWDKVIPIVLSVVALAISIISLVAQYNFSKKYSKQTDVVISNSILLALYDLDLLIFKVNHVNSENFDKDQMAFQIESLKSNLELVKSMRLDQLPEASTMNYQTYLKDLREVIYKLESDIRKFNQELQNTDDKTGTQRRWRRQFLYSLKITRSQLKEDRLYIKNDKNIFEEKYERPYDSMDKEASSLFISDKFENFSRNQDASHH